MLIFFQVLVHVFSFRPVFPALNFSLVLWFVAFVCFFFWNTPRFCFPVECSTPLLSFVCSIVLLLFLFFTFSAIFVCKCIRTKTNLLLKHLFAPPLPHPPAFSLPLWQGFVKESARDPDEDWRLEIPAAALCPWWFAWLIPRFRAWKRRLWVLWNGLGPI